MANRHRHRASGMYGPVYRACILRVTYSRGRRTSRRHTRCSLCRSRSHIGGNNDGRGRGRGRMSRSHKLLNGMHNDGRGCGNGTCIWLWAARNTRTILVCTRPARGSDAGVSHISIRRSTCRDADDGRGDDDDDYGRAQDDDDDDVWTSGGSGGGDTGPLWGIRTWAGIWVGIWVGTCMCSHTWVCTIGQSSSLRYERGG